MTQKFEFALKVFKHCGKRRKYWLPAFSFFHIVSSPEHEVLMVSYCDRAVSGVRRASSVVNFLPCVRSRGHSFGRILMKVGQDVCLDESSR